MAGLLHSFKTTISQSEDSTNNPSSKTLPVIHQDNSSSSATGVSVPDHGHGTDHVELDKRQQEQEEQQILRCAPSWPLEKLWFSNQLELGIDVETLLRPHLDYLCTHTTNVARMITIFYSTYSFTEEQSNLVVQQSKSYDLCYSLYLIAMRKNDGKQLLEAWEGSGNHHIMQHLQRATTQSFEDQYRCRPVSTTESILSASSSTKESDAVIIGVLLFLSPSIPLSFYPALSRVYPTLSPAIPHYPVSIPDYPALSRVYPVSIPEYPALSPSIPCLFPTIPHYPVFIPDYSASTPQYPGLFTMIPDYLILIPISETNKIYDGES